MASITTWFRLEATAASREELEPDMRNEAEARMYDPLWLVFRQWQLGEFQAADAGSLVMVQPTIRSAPVTRFAPVPLLPGKKVKGEKFSVGEDLLEARVEAEQRKNGPLAQRLDVEAGQELRSTLLEAGFRKFADAVAEAFPLAVADSHAEGSDARLNLLSGRVTDGRAVVNAIAKATRPSAIAKVSPALTAAQRNEIDAMLTAWSAWAGEWLQQPASESWSQEWLEYRFSLGLAGKQAVTTPGYTTEPNWFAFDAVQGASAGATEKLEKDRVFPAMLPTLVRYPGMASSRFWEFENEEVRLIQLVDKGSVLAKAVLDFVLVGGDDWFQLPVTLPTGAMHTVTSLTVTDTFGDEYELPPLGDYRGERRFALWRLSGSTQPSLFLPPPSGTRLESAPIERVELFSDELSNLYWAVEEYVEGFTAPRDRSSRWPSNVPPPEPTPGTPDVEYHLMHPPPPGYFPLVADGKLGGEKLLPAQVLRSDGEDTTADSRVLLDGPILTAVLPSGAGVSRSFQWARRPDGRMTLWVGRSRSAGVPPPSPQIGFDALIPAIRPEPIK